MQHVGGALNSPSASIGFNNTPFTLQNPPGMSDLSNAAVVVQNPSMAIQNPVGMANSQNPPTGALNVTGTTTLQNLPVVNQNPTVLSPGTTHIENQPISSLSSGNFTTFDVKRFMAQEVNSLGAVQIMTGLMHICLGSVLLYFLKVVLTYSGYPFWGGLSFIVSGTLSILAAKQPAQCMVRGSVGMNIVSAIFSIGGMLILITDLIVVENASPNTFISSVLFLFSFLECVITCVSSHFGCEAIGWNNWTTMILLPNAANTSRTMARAPQQGFTSGGEYPESLPSEGKKTPQAPDCEDPRS
uniref:Membrane-spanning 4-domains subfamily A member 18 n=1 Tax=Phascolarctos cinereus TaxID=38626 RepID=A0A6P5JKV9_PHACI|nr:membrane-spanning 4-domains subfamily A member 18 [Phascolarctos cinereus]